MANLQDLASLVALVYGVKNQRRYNQSLNRQRLAEMEADRDYKRQMLDFRTKQEANEAKRAEEEGKRKAQIARATQLRQTYMPLLNMGRTPADQAALSQQPERYQALLLDQADIAQMLASGDDSAWESFRPRFWGGRGFVAPPPMQAAPAEAPAPSGPPMGMRDPAMRPRGGPMGAIQPTQDVGPEALAELEAAMAAMGSAQPQPAAPVAPPAPTFQAPNWFGQAVPVPQKDAATIENLKASAGYSTAKTKTEDATRDLKVKGLQSDLADAVVKRDFTRANTILVQLRQATEKERPGFVRAQTKATESIPGYRAGQLAIGEERNDIARYGIDKAAETADENRASNERIAAARQQFQAKIAGVKDPLRQKLYGQLFDVLLNRSTNPLSGETMWQYNEAERGNALAGLSKMAGEDGLDLTGIGMPSGGGGTAAVDSLMGDLLGGGATPAPSAPAPRGAAAPAGEFTAAQINAVSQALANGTFQTMLRQTSPENQNRVKAIAAEVKRRQKAKGR